MATQWYWRKDETEQGPVSFKELVAMVRDEVLLEDDPVRPHYSSEWQPSASVVGLFHMAGRKDVLDKWEEERRQRELELLESQQDSNAERQSSHLMTFDDLEDAPDAVEGATHDGTVPSWQARMNEVAAQRASESQEQHKLALADQFAELKQQAAIAAIEKDEAKQLARSRSEAWALFNPWTALTRICSKERLSGSFKVGLTLLVAVLTAVGIHWWSETEQLRFPKSSSASHAVRPFPLYGSCTIPEYAFLLIDSTIAGGIIGYWASRALVNMADE